MKNNFNSISFLRNILKINPKSGPLSVRWCVFLLPLLLGVLFIVLTKILNESGENTERIILKNGSGCAGM